MFGTGTRSFARNFDMGMSELTEILVGNSILSADFFHEFCAFSLSARTRTIAFDLGALAFCHAGIGIRLAIGPTDRAVFSGAHARFRFAGTFASACDFDSGGCG